jgi:hypothetical protein
MANKRLFYAVRALGFARDGSTSYTEVHGVQSLGMTVNFGLETIQEIGQLTIYEQIDNMPDVELTTSKVIDGYPTVYELATRGYSANSLVGRSNQRSIAAISYYLDTQASASGDPISSIHMSGMFVSSLAYEFPVDGNCMEECTLVGNHRAWKTSSFTFTPNFTNTDTPLALASGWGGVQRRENVRFNYAGTPASGTRVDENNIPLAPSGTLLPPDVIGISSSGTNDLLSNFEYSCSVQRIRCSVDLGRENLLELGHKLPYHRFVNFPVATTTEIEIIAKDGDRVIALDSTSLSHRTIQVATDAGFVLHMGTRNKLASVSEQGGDTGGGNVTLTYTYQSYNDFTTTSPMMPA